MCDQEQGESSLGEVETDSLDVSRILEECADSDISELSQRAITDLDAEIHRLLGAESTSSEEETESRLSQASVSSIVFEEAASTLRRKQSSSPEQPKSSALYILYGPETESSSSQSAPESAESEDEMSADQVMVAIHSGPLETGTDKIAINTGTNTEVQFQGSDDDCRYEFEDSNSTECSPRPLADELEEVANKGTDPMSNQELDLNTLATSASSSSDELSSSGIDSEEEEIFTTTNTKDPHTLSTLKQQASYTPHDSVSEISPGQLALDMLATTDTEELSNVTSESDGEIIPMSAVGVHTMQEGTVTVQGAMHEGMIPVNLEMLATTDSEMDSDLSRSEIELPFQKSHSPHTLSTLKQQASYTPHDSVSEISPGQLALDMLATTDTEELSNVTSESDGEIIPMSAVGVHTMQEGTVTVQGAIHEGMIPVNLEMLATTDSEMDSDLSWSEKELPFQKSLCRDSSVSRGGTQTDGYREKSHNRTFVHTSELAELKTVHSNAPIGITLEMLAMPESDSSTVTESNDEEMYTAPSNLSEVCTEVATANPEINPKANGEHYNADTNHSGGEMAQDRHVQEISESEEGENTQLPPSQPENEDLKSFSSKSKTIANGSVKHLHVKEDVDGIDLEFQLGDTDTCPVLVPHPSSCSLPSDVQPASAACSLHAPVNEDLQQGHSPGIPELLRKVCDALGIKEYNYDVAIFSRLQSSSGSRASWREPFRKRGQACGT